MSQRPWVETTERQLQKEIGGVLRCVIDAHGPITPEKIGSASKRLVALMKAKGYWIDGEGDATAGLDHAVATVNDAEAVARGLGEDAHRLRPGESRAKMPERPFCTLRRKLGGKDPHSPRDSQTEAAA